MIAENVVVDPLEREMKQKCPRCESTNVQLEVPETLDLRFTKSPRSNKKSTGAGSRYYRLKCGDCKLSTQNHTNAASACNEWISFVESYKDKNDD